MVVRSGFLDITFDEKTFLSTVLGFTAGWDFKHYNEYISQKNVNLGTKNQIHLKCDVIEGSVQYGIRRLIPFSFILDGLPGNKVFCELETIHYKQIKKVLWIH